MNRNMMQGAVIPQKAPVPMQQQFQGMPMQVAMDQQLTKANTIPTNMAGAFQGNAIPAIQGNSMPNANMIQAMSPWNGMLAKGFKR